VGDGKKGPQADILNANFRGRALGAVAGATTKPGSRLVGVSPAVRIRGKAAAFSRRVVLDFFSSSMVGDPRSDIDRLRRFAPERTSATPQSPMTLLLRSTNEECRSAENHDDDPSAWARRLPTNLLVRCEKQDLWVG
jgi:hypothetical protein